VTAANGGHVCVATSTADIYCWGNDQYGQLGIDPATLGAGSTGTPTKLSPKLPGTPVQLASGGVGGIANAASTCALLDNQDLYCWGSNAYGQLGNGTSDTNVHATPVKVLGGIAQVAVSPTAGHLCAIKASDHSVWCWGANTTGSTGQVVTVDGGTAPGPDPVTTPAAVPGLTGMQSVALGDGTACAVTGSGGVQCWGDNSNGQAGADPAGNTDQCGSPALSCVLTPTAVAGLASVTSLGVGADGSCALTSQGAVTCWGVEATGSALGALSTTPDGAFHTPTPLPSPFDHGVSAFSMGAAPGKDWVCASVGGSLYCWGDNAFGQVGYLPGNVDHVPDVGVPILTMQSLGADAGAAMPSVSIVAASATVCAIGTDRSLWCWGADGQGEVSGGAGAPDSYVPHQLAPSSGLTL
jgi:alpha-tubulin suppressor-like RCC1 family protein